LKRSSYRSPVPNKASGRLEAIIRLSPGHREANMSPNGVADSVELTILTKALDDYCAAHHIVGDSERERIAIKVMSLFRQGLIRPEHLSAELEKID
jgi:hypothetical protein